MRPALFRLPNAPVFTAVASFFILGEHLFGMGWWGAALLLACIVYGNYIERKVEAILQTGSAVINSNYYSLGFRNYLY
jgi:hypothetical protein